MLKPNHHQMLLTFDVAGRQYALAANCIEQVLPLPEVARLPQAPPLLYGFLDLAGATVPVIRLQRLFQLPETPLGLWTPLIVVRDSGLRLALLVERVNQVVGIDAAAVRPLPDGHTLNDCVQGVWRSATGSVSLLSSPRLLLQQERAVLAELQDLARQRRSELTGVLA